MAETDKQPEILEPSEHKPDKVEREQTITTAQQNTDHNAALQSNPDQFHSVADLRVPNADQIEAFQIVDDGKLIASSRKVEQPVLDSFTTGLIAIPENATPEQLAQYQIDYIHRKVVESEAGTMPALQGRVEKSNNEYFERMAGFMVGTVQGIGNVAVNLARIADFAAYCVIGDQERAGVMGAELGSSIAETLVGGGKLFQASYDYLYDVGFEDNYSKPFSDIASLAFLLNDRWQQLSPREQERIKGEIVSQMVADGFLGFQAFGKGKNFAKLLDEVATKAAEQTGKGSKKLIETIGKHVDDLLQPEYALPDGGKIKMKDLPKVTKEDLYNAMAEWPGNTTQESVARKLDLYLLEPKHSRGGDKSEFFRLALGFTKENSQGLAKQIIFDETKATLLEPTEFGQKYQQIIKVTGANGREIDVPFVFIKNPDGVVRLVSVRKLGGRK